MRGYFSRVAMSGSVDDDMKSLPFDVTDDERAHLGRVVALDEPDAERGGGGVRDHVGGQRARVAA